MKTKIILSLAIALSVALVAQPMFANTIYSYTGNPFTNVTAPYTTSDFVSAMVTLAGPLAPNMPFTSVTPTAFTLSDGVQTITNFNANFSSFSFATGPTAAITFWSVDAVALSGSIHTHADGIQTPADLVTVSGTIASVHGQVPDAPGRNAQAGRGTGRAQKSNPLPTLPM